jgi:2-polyprenyl-3-methyl-5-hydroxy-6-metoxy-1,4-benzoquinol methylase
MNCPSCAGERFDDAGPYRGVHSIFQRMRLARCAGCGLVFAHPQPTGAELGDYYAHYWDGEVAASIASTRRYYLAQALSRAGYLRKFAKLDGTPAVLDMGAGLGMLREGLLSVGISHDYVAVESDRRQFAALCARLGEGAAYADLGALPSGRTFDLIVLAHVLEHVKQPNELIAALAARLRPGGILFVEVPNGDHRYKASFESHLLFFDAASLGGLLRKHGTLVDRSALRPLKEAVKTLLALCTPNFHDRQIARYAMSDYDGDRQWLRALLRRA